MGLHFFELKKLPTKLDTNDMLVMWLSLFRAETEEELEQMKMPRGKPQGIFVGEEIYYTGGVHTQYVLYLHVRCYSFNCCKQRGIDPALQ